MSSSKSAKTAHSQDPLHRVVVGALRTQITDHGNVADGGWVGSAAKRIVASIRACERDLTSLPEVHLSYEQRRARAYQERLNDPLPEFP